MLSMKLQLLESVMLKVCVPAVKALGTAVPQSAVNAPIPPLKISVAVPSFPPLQLTLVVVADAIIADGWVIVTLSV